MTSEENQRQNPEQRSAQQREGELRRQAEELKETVRERAGTVADAAQEKVSEVAEQAGEQARNMATERKSEVASQLDNVAQAFRSSGNQLRSEQHGGAGIANYMDRAAEGVGQLSGYLRDRNI